MIKSTQSKLDLVFKKKLKCYFNLKKNENDTF